MGTKIPTHPRSHIEMIELGSKHLQKIEHSNAIFFVRVRGFTTFYMPPKKPPCSQP